VRAKANLQASPIDNHFWWVVHFRRRLDRIGNPPEIEYPNQSFAVPAGKTASPTFVDHFPMEPGRYNVLIGLREARAEFDGAGNQILPHPYSFATSDWVTVP
jgi:hypothetical protein